MVSVDPLGDDVVGVVGQETTARDMLRVGQALHVSVEKFLSLGESIAQDNAEAKLQMLEACKDARIASNVVEQICDLRPGIDDVQEPCR